MWLTAMMICYGWGITLAAVFRGAKLNSKSAGMTSLKKDDNGGCGTAYDLLGRPTASNRTGVYIKNGKKWLGGKNVR